MPPLVHQTYREGKHLVYEPRFVKRMRARAHLLDWMCLAGQCEAPRDGINIHADYRDRADGQGSLRGRHLATRFHSELERGEMFIRGIRNSW
jgi:hypothetical protein